MAISNRTIATRLPRMTPSVVKLKLEQANPLTTLVRPPISVFSIDPTSVNTAAQGDSAAEAINLLALTNPSTNCA